MSRHSPRVASRFDAAPGRTPGPGRGGGRDAMLWLLAGALAIAGFIVLSWPSGSSSAPESPPSTETTTNSAQQPHRTGSTRVEPLSEPTPIPEATLEPEAAAVLEGFATDFTADVDIDAWKRMVSRWVTPQLAESYAHTASSRRPTGEVTAITPEAVGDHAINATIRYDTDLKVSVHAEFSADGWQVTSVLPRNH